MRRWILLLTLMVASPAWAQTNINLGGITTDPGAPVEVAADSLSVDQDTGTAIFDGNVVIGQGALRIAAGRAQVVYDATSGDIASFEATGGVTFANGQEAAEAQSANYDLKNGNLVLIGEVLLTQGASALSADRMTIDVATGNAQMEGRVRTVFQQGN
ncbi:MAG: lipopolysaccharide transport periplasmic protein LptA [Pseudomonadota bacterium]